ncbi:MAG: IS1/IS1595 family N-terminal zinc-binding domain-containing protein [Candidatus Entotheonellia bacterium]
MSTSFTTSTKARSSLTISCPQCHSTKIVKKGRRATHHDDRQRYGCRACGHLFIAQVTKLSSDPVTLIIEAVSRRNLGR